MVEYMKENKNKRIVRLLVVSLIINVIVICSCFVVYKSNSQYELTIDRLLKTSEDVYLDYKTSSRNESELIDAVFLYQSKSDASMHGIKVIIGEKCYTIAVAVEYYSYLGNNSKIKKIYDNNIEFGMELEEKYMEFKVSINISDQDINFKVVSLN